MPNMIFIPHSGEQAELSFHEMNEPVLTYMNNDWQVIMNYLECDMIEHVSVLYAQKRAHLMVDESGSLEADRAINCIASGIYWTNMLYNEIPNWRPIPIFGRAVLLPHGTFEEDQ